MGRAVIQDGFAALKKAVGGVDPALRDDLKELGDRLDGVSSESGKKS